MAKPTVSEQYRSLYGPYCAARRRHWDFVAEKMDHWNGLGGYYHMRLAKVYRHLIEPGLRVLEIGCGRGDLLDAVRPSFGIGIDFSEKMIARARKRHPRLHFAVADALHMATNETFDAVIVSDLVNDLWDIIGVLEEIRPLLHRSSRVILNSYSRVWELPLSFAKRIGKSKPLLQQNWVTPQDLGGMLAVSGYDPFLRWLEMLCPLPLPPLSYLANTIAVKLWPFCNLGLTNFLVARPLARSSAAAIEPLDATPRLPSVSIIVPARNESGNICTLFKALPSMDKEFEIIFVEGNSSDDTYDAIVRQCNIHPQVKTIILKQQGRGKADAVRLGFDNAHGDILMILDADLTVQPHDLSRFYEVLVNGEADFVNGVRLVYPMERKAMRFVNLAGNKLFCWLMSWIIGQHVKDTLCGTKVFWKRDWQKIKNLRSSFFGEIDPFGDFDLLLGAAKLNLKIVDIPVRYGERKYGTTNISRWRDALLLAKIVLRAVQRLKFI